MSLQVQIYCVYINKRWVELINNKSFHHKQKAHDARAHGHHQKNKKIVEERRKKKKKKEERRRKKKKKEEERRTKKKKVRRYA